VDDEGDRRSLVNNPGVSAGMPSEGIPAMLSKEISHIALRGKGSRATSARTVRLTSAPSLLDEDEASRRFSRATELLMIGLARREERLRKEEA
jgi:hypothetical protein